MYNCFKALSTDIVFNVLYIYIYILFYIKYNIHIVKRFRAHCGFYAIENKLLLLLLLLLRLFVVPRRRLACLSQWSLSINAAKTVRSGNLFATRRLSPSSTSLRTRWRNISGACLHLPYIREIILGPII